MGQKRDILIRVYGRPDANSSYPVDAEIGDDGGYFFGGELKIVDADLLKLSLNIPAYGAKLGQFLFSAPIQRALEKAYATVDSKTESELRLRLCFYPDARELHAYPWERLVVTWQGAQLPLAASSLIPFSRFVQLPDAQQGPIEDRPIRLLFAVSNPTRLPGALQAIKVEDELRGLVNAVSKVDDLSITILPGRTPLSDDFKAQLKSLRIALIEQPTTLSRLGDLANRNDVVHILCHGTYDSGTASLILEGDDGDCAVQPDTEIQKVIVGMSAKPRLIYLSACESAMQDPDDIAALEAKPRQPHPMVGLAPKLVEAGIPAVIAMQDLVEVELAHNLAAQFYSNLLECGEVDRALSQARATVYQNNSAQWAVPALFLRLREGRLFATDPAREALNATLLSYDAKPDRFYLPLEAISLKTPELIADWERTSKQNQTSEDLWSILQLFQKGLTVLIGDAGSGKSTVLERLIRATAQQPPENGVRIVPLLIELSDYPNVRSFNDNRIQRLVYDSFKDLVPSLSEERFRKLLAASSVRFRFLFDHGDQLPDRTRRDVLADITQMVSALPQHQFLIAIDCRSFRPWGQIAELLVVQPLSLRKVARFLDPDDGLPPDPVRLKLLDAIRAAELFEFAAVPWLLRHMLEQVGQNVIPSSRIMVLLDWLETALYDVSGDAGRSVRAPDSLCALAWKMQSERRDTLQLEEAFAVLDGVRGQRDYNLEELLNGLVRSEILVRAGDESIRFAYRPLQDYGTARHLLRAADQDDVLEEIVATLGQPSRVRWWTAGLALLAGMMVDPVSLLRKLVYGASLTQGEPVFIAALCHLEHIRAKGDSDDDELRSLHQQICAALEWRAKRANEPDVSFRSRAVYFLGLFRRKDAIPLLAKLAIEKVRAVEGKPPDYEYSQVRFAAIGALRNMQSDLPEALIAQYPDAAPLMQAWVQGDLPQLAALLHSRDVGIQGVAAFALGDLQTPPAAAELYSAFRASDTDPATLWAITDALQALEPSSVIADLVLPMVQEAKALARPPLDDKFERLIYLIGQLRTHEPRALEFLRWYLHVPLKMPLQKTFKGRALVALGRLHSEQDMLDQRWTEVARGNFESIAAADETDKLFLQRKAIEALGELGDLQMLYSTRLDQEWAPELDEAFFRAAEACMAFPGSKQITQLTKGGTESGTKRLHAGGV